MDVGAEVAELLAELPARIRAWWATPAAPGARRALALDVFGVLVLLGVGAARWRSFKPVGSTDLPWWAGGGDAVIFGPDAGAWASNAWALHLGRLSELDPHRLPAWPFLVAGMLHVQPDVALAAHLVNHLLHGALPAVVFLAAAPLCGRAGALAAGLVVAWHVPLMQASSQSGVDPLVALAPVLALAAGRLAGRVPLASWMGGALVAFATGTHLTTLGVAAPAALYALATGQAGWRRWAGAAGLVLGAAATLWIVTRSYPVLEPAIFLNSLAEGVTRSRADVGNQLADEGAALATLQERLPVAGTEALRWLLGEVRPWGMPWGVALCLPWLALARPAVVRALAAGERPESGWGVLARAQGWHLLRWLAFVGMLAPVVAFAAAASPERYGTNFLPVAIVVAVASVASVAALLDGLAARVVAAVDDHWGPFRWTPRWPAGVLVVLAGLAWGPRLVPREPGPPRRYVPTPIDRDAQELGRVLARSFPPGGAAAVVIREAAAVAGRTYCPNMGCPGPGVWRIGECVARSFAAQCPGEGPIPWVVVTRPGDDGTPDWRTTFDAWVEANHTPVDSYAGSTMSARVYALAREGGVPPKGARSTP